MRSIRSRARSPRCRSASPTPPATSGGHPDRDSPRSSQTTSRPRRTSSPRTCPTQLATALADPTLAPQGATLFPDTAQLGEPHLHARTPRVSRAWCSRRVRRRSRSRRTPRRRSSRWTSRRSRAIGEAAIRAAVKPGYQIVESSDRCDRRRRDRRRGRDGQLHGGRDRLGAAARSTPPRSRRASSARREADARAALAPYRQGDDRAVARSGSVPFPTAPTR